MALRAFLPVVTAAAVAGGVVGGVAGYTAGRRAARVDSPARGVDFAAAGGGMGMFEVTSAPKGATVTMDGRIVGKTPIVRLDAAPGQHAFVMELDGYEPWVGSTRVNEGQGVSVHGALKESATKEQPMAAAPPAAAPAPKARAAAPARPKIDCDGPHHTCKERCDSTSFDCDSRCQYCGSCTTDKTWDECNQICNTCRQGCAQNKEFCESGCDGQYDACQSQ